MTTATPRATSADVRVRLDLAYDGTEFSGWAIQPERRTVQGVVQDALALLLRASVQLTVAGRTDAGVHATGQVAHLDMRAADWARLGGQLTHRLAGLLPPDVRVLAATAVPPEFDARFAALWRRYEYRICDRDTGVDPLRRRHVLGWPRSLDADAMADAAHRLVGLHDFAAFCRRRRHDGGATTIRTLLDCDVARTGAEIACEVRADAFCHSMVRSLVGALLAVGEGRMSPSWPAEQLGRQDRAVGAAVVPPHGLTLVEVGYPPDDQLAARARRTRAPRNPGEVERSAAPGSVRNG